MTSGMNSPRNIKPLSGDSPERIAKNILQQENARCISGEGMGMVVMPIKASSNSKMRQNWTFTAGIIGFMTPSLIVGTFAMTLASLNLMNLTPMMTVTSPLQPH